jgi:hypothetical protein
MESKMPIDVQKLLENWPLWRRISELPAEVDRLHSRIDKLEQKLGGNEKWPPDVCKFCGDRESRLSSSSRGPIQRGNLLRFGAALPAGRTRRVPNYLSAPGDLRVLTPASTIPAGSSPSRQWHATAFRRPCRGRESRLMSSSVNSPGRPALTSFTRSAPARWEPTRWQWSIRACECMASPGFGLSTPHHAGGDHRQHQRADDHDRRKGRDDD